MVKTNKLFHFLMFLKGSVPDAPGAAQQPMYADSPADGDVLQLNCPACGKLYHFQVRVAQFFGAKIDFLFRLV